MKEEDQEFECERKELESQNLFSQQVQQQKEILDQEPPKERFSLNQIETDMDQMRRNNRAEIDELSK